MNPEPNKEHIQLWVDGLRSGEHERGEGALEKADGTRCCLGVGTRVAMQNGVKIVTTPRGGTTDFDGYTGSFPLAAAEWYGLPRHPVVSTDCDPAPGIPGGQLGAITANDDLHWTFDQIADALEKLYLSE